MPEKLPFHLLDNPIVRLWQDKDSKIYKIEIRHKDFSAYLDPPKEVKISA